MCKERRKKHTFAPGGGREKVSGSSNLRGEGGGGEVAGATSFLIRTF